MVATLEDTQAEVDVLAETHLRKTTQLLVDLTPYAHVERTGIELVEFLLAAAYAAGGEETGH